MGSSDVNFEDQKTVLEVEVINEEVEQEQNLAQDQDDKLNALADLIVKKLLASENLPTVVTASASKNLGSNKTISAESSERGPRPSRYHSMRDLIDPQRKSLGLSKKSQFAEQYLKTIKLIYSELAAELGDKFFGHDANDLGIALSVMIKEMRYKEGVAGLLTRIEKFVLVLGYSPTPAYIFDNESKGQLKDESLTQVKSRITAIGYELLYILDHLEQIKNVKNTDYLSTNIQLFIKYMSDYEYQPNRRTGKGRDLINQQITFEALNELNQIVGELHKAIKIGEYDEISFYSPAMLKRTKDVKLIQAKLDAEGFKETLGKYSKRLQSVISYFRAYKSTSISLYRMRIGLISQDGKEVTLEQFKKYFGELNKQASKSTVGFEGYLNFFYIWDRAPSGWFQDIVLILDSETLLRTDENNLISIRNITEEFHDFAQKYLDHRAEVIFAEQMKPQLQIDPVSLMYHLDLASQLLLDVGNQETWKIFENSILPFFLYHELLELNLDEEISSRFRRGTKKIGDE